MNLAVSSRPPKKKRKLNNGARYTTNQDGDNGPAEELSDIGEICPPVVEDGEGEASEEGDDGEVREEEDQSEHGEVESEEGEDEEISEVDGEQRELGEDDGDVGFCAAEVEETVEANSPLAELPNELLHKIFGFLDVKTLCRIACLSRRFKTVAYDPALYTKLNLTGLKWCIQEALAALPGRCGRLRKLDVSVWGGEDIHLDPFMSETGSKLTHLWANYASISLPDCSNLVELSLDHTNVCNGLGGWNNLPSCTHLRKLDVASSNADQGVITSVLQSSRELRYLDIRNSNVRDLDLLLTTMGKCSLSLEVLKLTANESMSSSGIALLSHLVHLHTLHIQYSKCELFGNGLLNVFKNCRKLTSLNLENCHLTPEVIAYLLRYCNQLTYLNLATNYIINQDMCIRILANMPELKVLCVASCSIKARELEDIKDMYPNILFVDK